MTAKQGYSATRAAGLDSDKHIRTLISPTRALVALRGVRQRELNAVPGRNRQHIDSDISLMPDVGVNAGWKDLSKAPRDE